MAGGSHPVGSGDAALAIDLNLQHANGVEQGRHFAVENPVGVFVVEVTGCIATVIAWTGGGRDDGRGVGRGID